MYPLVRYKDFNIFIVEKYKDNMALGPVQGKDLPYYLPNKLKLGEVLNRLFGPLVASYFLDLDCKPNLQPKISNTLLANIQIDVECVTA